MKYLQIARMCLNKARSRTKTGFFVLISRGPLLACNEKNGLHIATRQNFKTFEIYMIDISIIKRLCISDIKVSFNNKYSVLFSRKT